MSRKQQPRRDVAAEITALIIRKLEEGVAPWNRPWRQTGGSRPLRHCGKPYTGINNLYLWAVADTFGYRSNFWMTYRQAHELGGQVRKGETGSLSIYFSSFSKVETDVATGNEVERKLRFMRHYNVFNADQIDGLPPHFYPPVEPEQPVSPSEHQAAIDRFFDPIPVEIRHGGNRAFFSPSGNYIQLPHARAFRSMDHYASTKAHEIVHWSGGEQRLARTFGKRFGDKAYSFEELVAEIGSGLICAELGLPNELHDSHASYIGHWIGILKGDNSAIIHAASKAEQAFRYLSGFSATQSAEGVEDDADMPVDALP